METPHVCLAITVHNIVVYNKVLSSSDNLSSYTRSFHK